MIYTILYEKEQAFVPVRVDCIVIPGVRKIVLSRSLRTRYADFIPKISLLLKRFGYTKYMERLYINIEADLNMLQSRYYELPIALAIFQALGLFPDIPLICNGTIDHTSQQAEMLPHYSEIASFSMKDTLGLNYLRQSTTLPKLLTSPEAYLQPLQLAPPVITKHQNKLVLGQFSYMEEILTKLEIPQMGPFVIDWLKQYYPSYLITTKPEGTLIFLVKPDTLKTIETIPQHILSQMTCVCELTKAFAQVKDTLALLYKNAKQTISLISIEKVQLAEKLIAFKAQQEFKRFIAADILPYIDKARQLKNNTESPLNKEEYLKFLTL